MKRTLKIQFSLSQLLVFVLCIGFLFGSVRVVGLFYGILVSVILHVLFYAGTKKKGWRIIAIFQVALLIALMLLIAIDNLSVGPYTRYFNHSMYSKAMEARLVGANEERVEQVLGKASYCYSGWTSTYIDSGKPTPHSRFVTTYNYVPFLPAAKFQVHCKDGKVVSLEMFDD